MHSYLKLKKKKTGLNKAIKKSTYAPWILMFWTNWEEKKIKIEKIKKRYQYISSFRNTSIVRYTNVENSYT